MTLEHSVKCFRRRRQRWASRRATIFRKRRTLPSGRECLSTPCARYIFRFRCCSALCRFIHFYLSLPLALSLSLAPAPVLHLPRFLVFYYPVLSPPPHPTSPRSVSPLMFCSLQRSIIFRPNDFTSRLDRSTTPTDVIAVRGHHMISQMSSCQHRRLVDFFISYPLISVLQLSTSSSSVPKYCIFYII